MFRFRHDRRMPSPHGMRNISVMLNMLNVPSLTSRTMLSRSCRVALSGLCALLAVAGSTRRVHAQTDFLNTDGGRPLHVQDALSIEWKAVELQLAPFKMERGAFGKWYSEMEPELAIGLLPRTHLSLGLPIRQLDTPRSRRGIERVAALAGAHLSVFHQLNLETTLPAFAVRAEAWLPAGPFAVSRAYPAITGIATKTLSALGPVRVHANVTRTLGGAAQKVEACIAVFPPVCPPADTDGEVPRWLAGLAIDRAFPLQSTLIGAELVARQSVYRNDPVEWRVGAGVRHQFSARFVLDGGVSRDISGDEAHWAFTVGSALAIGTRRAAR